VFFANFDESRTQLGRKRGSAGGDRGEHLPAEHSRIQSSRTGFPPLAGATCAGDLVQPSLVARAFPSFAHVPAPASTAPVFAEGGASVTVHR